MIRSNRNVKLNILKLCRIIIKFLDFLSFSSELAAQKYENAIKAFLEFILTRQALKILLPSMLIATFLSDIFPMLIIFFHQSDSSRSPSGPFLRCQTPWSSRRDRTTSSSPPPPSWTFTGGNRRSI
jgi:hypothetical protein